MTTLLRPLLMSLLRAAGLYHPLRDRRRDRLFVRNSTALIATWEQAGRPSPAPEKIKYEILRDCARLHGFKVLVETGTYFGNSIFTLRNEFTEIHSIELAPALHERAVLELAHLPHIHLHLGDSARVLPEVVRGLKAPTLYWLDGHFCSGPTARADKDTPIDAELDFLLNRPLGRDMVLIDDARLFTGDGIYPSIAEVRAKVAARRPGADFNVETDTIRIFPV